ncbi:MAG: hypothetical protein ACRDZ3_15470 [Acidimicrobiia bacterium]
MPRLIPRPMIILATSTALTFLPLSASSATGTFEYCAGEDCRTLTDPRPAACFTLEVTATSVTNGTDSFATLYPGRHCSDGPDDGHPVGPGEAREVPPSNSVVFSG